MTDKESLRNRRPGKDSLSDFDDSPATSSVPSFCNFVTFIFLCFCLVISFGTLFISLNVYDISVVQSPKMESKGNQHEPMLQNTPKMEAPKVVDKDTIPEEPQKLVQKKSSKLDERTEQTPKKTPSGGQAGPPQKNLPEKVPTTPEVGEPTKKTDDASTEKKNHTQTSKHKAAMKNVAKEQKKSPEPKKTPEPKVQSEAGQASNKAVDSSSEENSSEEVASKSTNGGDSKRIRRNSPPTEQEKNNLIKRVAEVEKLADKILERDPKNDVIKHLAPQLVDTLKDIQNGEIAGIEAGLDHIKKLLIDIESKLPADKVEDKSAKAEPNKDGKTPVDEVVPDPKHIAPRETTPVKDTPTVKDVTNKVEQALHHLEKDPHGTSKQLQQLLGDYPNDRKVMLAYAKSLDKLAEVEKSNARLEQAINVYRKIFDIGLANDITDDIFKTAGILCAERMAFRGFLSQGIKVLQQLSQKFPDDVHIKNKLGVQYLMTNQVPSAQETFREALAVSPNDGFAQAHYGFTLKDQNYTEAIKYLSAGIESGADGTKDGRFYFQLGDAYHRLGRSEEAYEIFDKGVEHGLFLSRYQRSLYNVDHLKSKPVWTVEETTYGEFFRKLENNWEKIRDEGIKALSFKEGFEPESENLKDTGDWKQFELFARGKKNEANCLKTPLTCRLVEEFPAAAGCKRGQVKFSIMEPGTHVWPHTGPTNCRLRSHLGLVVPKGLKLRVAEQNLTWQEGRALVFDDSFEHEVWHEGDTRRLVLIVDVWHPDLSEAERRTLTAI